MKTLVCVLVLLALTITDAAYARAVYPAQPTVLKTPTTYCNPLNLDYGFELYRGATSAESHRSTADPVCLLYRDKYFLFSTNQEGYWLSDDLATWKFLPCKFKPNASGDQVCAPAAWVTKKGVLFLPCYTQKDDLPLYISKDPAHAKWSEATSQFKLHAWDPSLFQDDDGKLYVYWNSSNVYPIYGVELDPKKNYAPLGERKELIKLHPQIHGWEQFGQNNQNGSMAPFIEGAWMNKFGGHYYLQYGAPGTEFNVYGDGVYTSEHPLGPFVYQKHNPFSWKPTGFIPGAGHGSTFKDKFGNLWHVATMVVAVKYKFERRLGLFPAGLDKDGCLFASTAFGDYPHFVPRAAEYGAGFAGWTLLSYKKRGWSDVNEKDVSLAFDEDVKTYWSAGDGNPGHFLAVDLGHPADVSAIQVNFAVDGSKFFGKQMHIRHRYQILISDDGKNWTVAIDKSQNSSDVPHDYIELSSALRTRYLKVLNFEVPPGAFAIGDLRVFGRADGPLPAAVKTLSVSRDSSDRRNASLSWSTSENAYAYNIEFGTDPDKLYSSLLVCDNKYELHGLNTECPYYFRIQAVGETGLGPFSKAIASN